jgi:hypothetical protein
MSGSMSGSGTGAGHTSADDPAANDCNVRSGGNGSALNHGKLVLHIGPVHPPNLSVVAAHTIRK